MFKQLLASIIKKKDYLVLKYLLSDKELKQLANRYVELEEQYRLLENQQDDINNRLKELLEELDYLSTINSQDNKNEEHY